MFQRRQKRPNGNDWQAMPAPAAAAPKMNIESGCDLRLTPRAGNETDASPGGG